MGTTIILMITTVTLAIAVGYFFIRYKVPGGLLIGSLLVFATMQVLTGDVQVIPGTKDVAQVIAGCFIGASLSTDDLKRLPRLWKAFTVIVIGLIVLNLSIGLLIFRVSDLSITTALFATIPGGMNTIPIISSDYGADPIVVTVMQFMRMLMGIGVFPSLVVKISQKFNGQTSKGQVFTDEVEFITSDDSKEGRRIPSIVTLIISAIFALSIIRLVPGANLMVLALIATAILNVTIGVKPLPIFYRRIAQLLSGWFVGAQFYAEQFNVLSKLIVPIMILIPTFLLGCLIIGYFVHKIQKLPLTDSLLASIPAGASDVVLILGDLNIKNTDIVVLQVLRVVVVTSLFPQIVALVSYLLN